MKVAHTYSGLKTLTKFAAKDRENLLILLPFFSHRWKVFVLLAKISRAAINRVSRMRDHKRQNQEEEELDPAYAH